MQSTQPQDQELNVALVNESSRWLRLARPLALLFILFCLALFIAGLVVLPGYAGQHPEAFEVYTWSPQDLDQILSRIGLSFVNWIGYQIFTTIFTALIFYVTGLFLFLRMSQDWFSLFVATVLVLYGTLSGLPITALADRYPAWNPLFQTLGVSAWALFFTMLFYFPNGRLVPRWTRWVVVALLLLFFIALVVYGGDTPPVPLVLLLFVLVGIGVASQVYRFRRVSTPLERQQTKWVILAVLVLFITLFLSLIPSAYPSVLDPRSPLATVVALLNSLTSFVLVLFPLSIGFAILRYRLWDVDLLIRRTLVYSALIATLLALYFVGVVALQELFQLLTGQHQSSIATVLSTLAIAAMFNLLLKRIKDAIDRRFYRRRYNAEQTLQSFATTLRDEVDLEQLSNHLVAVVQETMQPENISLWLRETKKPSPLDRVHG